VAPSTTAAWLEYIASQLPERQRPTGARGGQPRTKPAENDRATNPSRPHG
jgi:hypothetical protein